MPRRGDAADKGQTKSHGARGRVDAPELVRGKRCHGRRSAVAGSTSLMESRDKTEASRRTGTAGAGEGGDG
jgi:hypothetical protein